MGKREKKVEKIVNDVCTNCFCMGLFDKGREILQKLYLKDYNYLDNIHTRRDLLYRLIVAERRSEKGTEEAVKMYVKQLKYDMDNTPNYKEENLGEYLSMMSYYTDCKGIILNNDELIEYYDCSYKYNKKIYEINKSTDSYIKMKIAKFNKARLQKNFSIVLELVKDIHNINDSKAISTLEQMLCDIKELDNKLYKKAFELVNTVNFMACI
jgi:tetratricopeptide (TPR) repeat protein